MVRVEPCLALFPQPLGPASPPPPPRPARPPPDISLSDHLLELTFSHAEDFSSAAIDAGFGTLRQASPRRDQNKTNGHTALTAGFGTNPEEAMPLAAWGGKQARDRCLICVIYIHICIYIYIYMGRIRRKLRRWRRGAGSRHAIDV